MGRTDRGSGVEAVRAEVRTKIPRGVAIAGFSFLVAAAPIAVGADMLGGALGSAG